MRKPHLVVLTILLALVAAGVGGGLFIQSGLYDISAVTPHIRPVYHAIKVTRDLSVERAAREVQVPPLGGAEQLAQGRVLFREHCVRCHGAPGVAPEPFALGLQPLATPLARSGRDLEPQSIYWIIRNGIKMTSMPAFVFRMDEAGLWAVVAAVRELPTLSPMDYRILANTRPAVVAGQAEAHKPLPDIDAQRGRLAIGQYGCAACHDIPGLAGPEARVGPTLHGIASRLMLGGVLPNSPENMARWLQSPQSVSPLTAMPDLGVTERDARDMAAYLGTLK